MPEIRDGGDGPLDLTVLLPAYNEEQAIAPVVREIRAALEPWPGTWEILIVDDGSSDKTADVAEAEGARVLRRAENTGYGATLKAGVREARGRIVATMDADGSYVPSYLPEMLSYFPRYDQVNGARASEEGTLKALRSSIKFLIRKLAERISKRKIPDLNTGMKVFKRDMMLRYFWTLPDGFSCSTSMTLAFMSNGHPVKYIPVEYRKRIGQSKFHPIKDAARYGSTVIRIMMYFRPLRVFTPLAIFLLLIGLARVATRSIIKRKLDLADFDDVLFVTAVEVLVIGLLADLIVAQRREPA